MKATLNLLNCFLPAWRSKYNSLYIWARSHEASQHHVSALVDDCYASVSDEALPISYRIRLISGVSLLNRFDQTAVDGGDRMMRWSLNDDNIEPPYCTATSLYGWD